jgi:hypothetical protein
MLRDDWLSIGLPVAAVVVPVVMPVLLKFGVMTAHGPAVEHTVIVDCPSWDPLSVSVFPETLALVKFGFELDAI